MAEIVTLRTQRKRKRREEKQQDASDSRARFGRTKSEKQHATALQKLDREKLEGHVRDSDAPEE
jgi:hypothetical protein